MYTAYHCMCFYVDLFVKVYTLHIASTGKLLILEHTNNDKQCIMDGKNVFQYLIFINQYCANKYSVISQATRLTASHHDM